LETLTAIGFAKKHGWWLEITAKKNPSIPEGALSF
jgi:hypothetical protein